MWTDLTELVVLMLLLSVPSGTAVPVSSFYSYGSAAGDSVLPPTDDGSSPNITLPAPFLFFGANYYTIYVNNNGDLSFGVPWSGYSPTAFPIPNIPLVAPYQADVYTNFNGSVWYRSTQNVALLAKAANDIRLLYGTIISPQWLFIATWDHVGYCCSLADKTNTFQSILVTDNIKSYAIFLYADGLIQWPSSGAQVGFNAGDNINYYNVQGSRTPNILNITQMSNVGIGGKWVFQVNQGGCALGISGCNQICTNTNNGSYVCSCYLGYHISSDNKTCIDTDECTLGISGCNQICTNTNGSYVCSCYLGYHISSDNKTCIDINECAQRISGCNQICTNTNGSFVCSCYLGYQLTSNNRICADVNECAMGTSACNQICTNTNGSYVCDCYFGYQLLSSNKTCSKETENLFTSAIDSTLTTSESVIGVTGAMCAFTIICCISVVFIGYKCLKRKLVLNQPASNRTSYDIPSIKMSQCGAYDSIDYKGSRPMDEPYIVVDNNAPSTPSTVTGKEDNLYESTR